jgi:hypothetical protein
MLTTKLSRARLELQAHRTWLRTFSLRINNASSSFSTTARSANSTTRSRQPNFRKIPLPTSPFNPARDEDKFARLQRELSGASKETNIVGAMDAYKSIREKNLIPGKILYSLTFSMHLFAASQRAAAEDKQDPETSEKVKQFATELVEEVCRGTFEPNPSAWAQLLNYLGITRNWDVATKFWRWLKPQDDANLNGEVYGSAIKMMAAQDTKLEDLEAMYQEALVRFPFGFAEYHYSPGAIVPDRDLAMVQLGRPSRLLLAIMEARLMRGDTQNAYLALDAAVRLQPAGLDHGHLFYGAFHGERPVSEVYTVFAMACRSGTVLSTNTYRSVLSSLRNDANTKDASRFMLTVRAMLSATYLQIGGGGKFNRNAVTELIIVLTNILRVEGVSSMPAEEKLRLAQALRELISKVLELATRFSTKPTIAAYNSIITNIAGAGQAEATITAAVKEARVLGLDPTTVTRRSIIVAAGTANDGGLVKKGWKWLVEARVREGTLPDTTDLHILTKACVQSNIDEFAAEAINLSSHIEDWQRENLLERLEKRQDESKTLAEPANIDVLLAEVAWIKADLEVFDKNTSDAKGLQDFSKQVVPMLLFPPPKDVRLPEAEMRKLYDELTTDSNAPPKKNKETPHVSRSTNVPFGQLRYENWKLITYLLARAEAHDKAYGDAVDAAIAKGERPPQRSYSLSGEEEKITGVGLSDPVLEFEVSDSEEDINKARARICELRKVELPMP